MWRHTLIAMLRRLAGDPGYTAITVGGLALGLAGTLLILGYVHYERSYDRWIADSDRIYQVQTTITPPAMAVVRMQASPFPLRAALPVAFPQVEAITSIAVGKTVTEHRGEPMFIDAQTVDPDFFKVFALPFAQGSAGRALPDTNSIVLTQSEAIRQFGTADALGRRITLGAGEGKRDYRVSGVLRDLPADTSLKLSLIYRRDLDQVPASMRGWGNFDQRHYVKLRRGADAAALNAAIPVWERRAIPPGSFGGKPGSLADFVRYRLVPIGDVHLGGAQERALTPGGDPQALATFLIVAFLTLGMAVMNCANLTTARAVQRAREVALRKALGATRRQLILQFLAENALVCAAAMVIALAIAEVTTPLIGRLLGAELRFSYFGNRGMMLPALALLAVTAIAGSLYPALYLSGVRPGAALHGNRGSVETSGSGRVRTALVVVQFAIATGLIASTAVIYSQTRFIERVDPGFRRDGIVAIANAWRFTQGAEFDAARTAMLAVPEVVGTGRSAIELASSDKAARLVRGDSPSQYVTLRYYGVDPGFLRTMDLRLLAGRLLDERRARDQVAGTDAQLAARGLNVLVNRTGAARLGYHSPEGALDHTIHVTFGAAMVPATIAGVVEDSRFGTAREAVDAAVYAYDTAQASQVFVRYAGAHPHDVMAGLHQVWRRFEPEIPFEARLVDDIVRDIYAAERARAFLFAAFSLLAVLIACFGLYSLAAFTAERRTKEIGIRKVFGARVRDIVRLLAWQFSKPVVLANLVAWPIAWWAMRDWLNTFDARIALGPGPFVLAGLIALGIAVGTVAGHALRVARLNPVHALRHE